MFRRNSTQSSIKFCLKVLLAKWKIKPKLKKHDMLKKSVKVNFIQTQKVLTISNYKKVQVIANLSCFSSKINIIYWFLY